MASASWGLTKKTVGVLGQWVLGDDEDEDLVATNVTDLTYTPPPASTSIPKDILDADTVLWNIGWIVECCQCILQYAHTYSQQESQSPQNDDPFYRVNRHDTGGGPVILLDRHGTGPDSVREFCRAAAAANHDASAGGSTITELPWQAGVDLLATLLVASRHNVTLLEHDTILVFSSNSSRQEHDLNDSSSSQVYVALFQLNQTRVALSRRRVGLEGSVAHQTKRALEEKRKGRTKSALHYLRLRNQLEHELDTCASLEVSVECHVSTLEQTQTQRQVVHALTHMRSAMTALRHDNTNKIIDVDDVHQLLDDIRHDTDQVDAVSHALATTHIHTNNTVDSMDDTELELELQQLLQEEEENETTMAPPLPPVSSHQTTTTTTPDDNKEPIRTNDTILPEQSPAESSTERTKPTPVREPMAA
eukprot:scaffold79395_cov45-Attheya_sp.AAC.1